MPTFKKLLPLLILLLLFFSPRPARAHDLDSSTVDFWLRSTGMDVEVYLASAAGNYLLNTRDHPITLDPDSFPDISDRLRAVAPSLLLVTAANHQTLTPDSYSVSLSDENDIIYHLHYPLPAALPSPLFIHAAYLEKLGEGHQGMIFVNAASIKGDRYGYGEVRLDAPDLTAHLPALAALPQPPAPSPSASQSQPAPPIALPQPLPPAPNYLPMIALLTATTLLVLVALLHKKSRIPPSPSPRNP